MSKQTLRLALITAAILFAAPSVLAESFAEVQVTARKKSLLRISAILTVKTSLYSLAYCIKNSQLDAGCVLAHQVIV